MSPLINRSMIEAANGGSEAAISSVTMAASGIGMPINLDILLFSILKHAKRQALQQTYIMQQAAPNIHTLFSEAA